MTVTDTDTDTDAVVGIARNVDAATTDRLSCPVVLPDSPGELVAVLRATMERLGEALWAAETEDALLAAHRGLEAARCAAVGVDAQLFTEINDRCAYTREGFTHPIGWLAKGLRLGRGEARTGGFAKPSLLANAFEALCGAVFRDAGFSAVQAVVERLRGVPAIAELRSAVICAAS